MPGVRIASRTAVADQSAAGGFFIRRLASPGVAVEKGAAEPLARRAQSPSNNKENVPPVRAATTVLKRRSSLPEWYPRTPLRDITAVIKALESKSRLRDAAARQQIELTEGSPQSVSVDELQETEQGSPQSVSVDELRETEQGSLQSVSVDELQETEQDVPPSTQPPPTNETLAAAAASAQTVASTATTGSAEGMLKATDGDYSLQTPSRPSESAALTDVMEKKLASSIEQIEKMVSRNAVRRDPKVAQPPSKNPAVQRRTLMSMR